MKKKSLSAKKITVNNLDYKKILKDKKIFEVFKKFAKNIEDLKISGKIAVSISGGPDSLALCFLISCYKFKADNKILPFFYLIDHGLRKNSNKEAQLVKKQLRVKKINLKILKWIGKKPKSNIQSLARQKRYSLLFNECKKYNIKTVITGHHQDDFYETFFIRLLRGSGIEGLSSFSETQKIFWFEGNPFIVARPLLSLNKQDLVYIAKQVFNFYVNDPSNKMEKFQRVRIRNLILNLKTQGLDFKKLKLTLDNLSSTNKTINQIVNKNISENVIIRGKSYLIGPNFFIRPDEIVFRSLSILIKNISERDYPPRGKKLINLVQNLKRKGHYKATLGGTIIEKLHKTVLLTKEKTKKR